MITLTRTKTNLQRPTIVRCEMLYNSIVRSSDIFASLFQYIRIIRFIEFIIRH